MASTENVEFENPEAIAKLARAIPSLRRMGQITVKSGPGQLPLDSAWMVTIGGISSRPFFRSYLNKMGRWHLVQARRGERGRPRTNGTMRIRVDIVATSRIDGCVCIHSKRADDVSTEAAGEMPGPTLFSSYLLLPWTLREDTLLCDCIYPRFLAEEVCPIGGCVLSNEDESSLCGPETWISFSDPKQAWEYISSISPERRAFKELIRGAVFFYMEIDLKREKGIGIREERKMVTSYCRRIGREARLLFGLSDDLPLPRHWTASTDENISHHFVWNALTLSDNQKAVEDTLMPILRDLPGVNCEIYAADQTWTLAGQWNDKKGKSFYRPYSGISSDPVEEKEDFISSFVCIYPSSRLASLDAC